MISFHHLAVDRDDDGQDLRVKINYERKVDKMKYQYQTFNFRANTLELIGQANEIIDEYLAEGYELTLRQLYYQFVARGIIPNKDSEYKRIGSVVNDGRLAGEIDWDAIVDRTRKIQINSHWDDPSEILQSSADCYAIDTRATQDVYVEVWIEKEALAGILERACEPLDVPYFSCRGYVSQSAMWRAAKRINRQCCYGSKENYIEKGTRKAVILHLGDHDPSGIDMTRDIQDRLVMLESEVEVNRIALNMEQIKEYQPPPNPAKTTDSRYQSYIVEYGEESWELDALDPRMINDLITQEVNNLTNKARRKIQISKQEKQRKKLQAIADNYDNNRNFSDL